MNESRLLWLAIGVFVGYVLWCDTMSPNRPVRRTRAAASSGPVSHVAQDTESGLPPSCGCSGGHS